MQLWRQSGRNLKDMGKSDEYIEYEAYKRYLRKVTFEDAGSVRLKEKVMSETLGMTEMQAAAILIKRLAAAVAVVLACALVAAGIRLFHLL